MDSMMTRLFQWLNMQWYLAEGGDATAQMVVWIVKTLMYGSIVLFLLTLALWFILPWTIGNHRKIAKRQLEEQRLTNLYLELIDKRLETMTKNAITLISRRKHD